mmetsp:Transcript_27860/g.63800  ORF Transcript_27860/g.63800 Transcript_27860/m.63800 type:complete len:172 (-) Transcript_27860:257-772(-)|eukprot:CAMPEP_0113320322 /NCGR_PEP_ID=MMETSP0010_2-20120614/14184_1 /TAXON_ID=216773 ORGANISM="Corethron hystrix, Strain 308" /NCGR_SAMPLE_ID=MMETSP0010_2 /ASSEMBLY_ACC=CAM_ASM_000155 /LENGTH=171 /DNA_ID=CAMNT_0000178095 /DNA_START=54 /DNA_END=569 /DNA_ORIENTATION=- /assembly_acc=CAM_ASM_000155
MLPPSKFEEALKPNADKEELLGLRIMNSVNDLKIQESLSSECCVQIEVSERMSLTYSSDSEAFTCPANPSGGGKTPSSSEVSLSCNSTVQYDEPSWWHRLCVPTIEESYGAVCGDPSLDVVDEIANFSSLDDVLMEMNEAKRENIPALEEISTDGNSYGSTSCYTPDKDFI